MLHNNLADAINIHSGMQRSRGNFESANPSTVNENWAKRSLGMNSGSAGLTSEGKILTDGLDYSSSAIDMVSAVNVATLSNINSERKS